MVISLFFFGYFSKLNYIRLDSFFMTDKDNRIEALNKILESKELQTSKIKKKLLCYLFDAAINGKEIKEYTIAVDVFDKKNFNPSEDSSVRVYISNLRKILENYYKEEGASEKIKLHIPKGRYEIVFIDPNKKAVNEKSHPSANYKYMFWISSAVSSVLIIALGLVLIFSGSKKFDTTFIWKEFNKSSNPKMLILGNDLFYLTNNTDDEVIMRRHSINSVTDFEKFKSQNPEEKTKTITPYPFFPLSSVSSLPIIFQKANLSGCNLISSAKVTLNDLLANDILFIGSFRNLYLLDRLLKDQYFKFVLIQNHITLTVNATDSAKTYNLFGEPGIEHTDYCVLRKIPGPGNNTIILFLSFFDTGIKATLNLLNNADEISKLESMFKNKYGEVPQYFDVVFKVSGYSRTALKIGVEHIHKINPQKMGIWE